MLPDFFLDITENTGDSFLYEIILVKDIKDISLQRNPVTLVRSVVRSRKIDSLTIPSCRVSPIGYQFYNRDSIELFGKEDVEASHAQSPPHIPINPNLSQVMNSSQVMGDIDEISIGKLYLYLTSYIGKSLSLLDSTPYFRGVSSVNTPIRHCPTCKYPCTNR